MSQQVPEKFHNTVMLAIAITVAIQEFSKVHQGVSGEDVLSALATVHANLLQEHLGHQEAAAALRSLANMVEHAAQIMARQAPSKPTTH